MEFEVDGLGRMLLRRRTMFRTWEPEVADGHYLWELSYVVEGMAGAVTLSMQMEHHRTETAKVFQTHGTLPLFAATIVPKGLHAHAYRPWPRAGEGQTADKCHVLGGACFSQDLDNMSSSQATELVRRLSNPGGAAAVWDELSRLYHLEFCPPSPESERLAQLEAVVAALGRSDDPPTGEVNPRLRELMRRPEGR